MRILNNPNPQKETIMVCETCQCEFAYTDSDVGTYTNGILGHGHYGYTYIMCPNCGKMVILSDSREENGLKVNKTVINLGV